MPSRCAEVPRPAIVASGNWRTITTLEHSGRCPGDPSFSSLGNCWTDPTQVHTDSGGVSDQRESKRYHCFRPMPPLKRINEHSRTFAVCFPLSSRYQILNASLPLLPQRGSPCLVYKPPSKGHVS